MSTPTKNSWTATTCFKATCKLSQWAGVGVGRAWRGSDGGGSRMSSMVAVSVRHFMKGHLPGPACRTHISLSGVHTARHEAILSVALSNMTWHTGPTIHPASQCKFLSSLYGRNCHHDSMSSELKSLAHCDAFIYRHTSITVNRRVTG